jgi:hypothetical protein
MDAKQRYLLLLATVAILMVMSTLLGGATRLCGRGLPPLSCSCCRATR